MAHWLRVLVLAEDPDSGSSTHMGVHKRSNTLLTYADTRHAYDTQT